MKTAVERTTRTDGRQPVGFLRYWRIRNSISMENSSWTAIRI
ncbi:hypothetical protein [Bacteroides caccae]|nr:hypothetical protein [Bacteroides caccae]